jgi:Tol biopolymer transport system component
MKQFALIIATLIVLTSSVSSQETIHANGEGYWLSVQSRVANIIQGNAPSGIAFGEGALALVVPPNSQINPVREEDTLATAFTQEPTLLRDEFRQRPTETLPVPPSLEQPTLQPFPSDRPENRATETLPVPPSLEATLEAPIDVVSTQVKQSGDDVVEQSCAAQATYITPPGQIPVVIEWTVIGTNIDSVVWEFHDGSTSSATTVQYTYDTPGTYSVVLKCYGPLGEIIVNNTVEILESDGTQVGVITVTPSPTQTFTETMTPSLTRTPRPTITPGGPSLTPSVTRTARPTNTPKPPTATATPETICEVGVLPDPDTPGAYQFYLTEEVNVETAVWHINGQTYYGTEITALFIETGVYEVQVECVSAYDIIQKTVFVQIEVVTSVNVDEGTLVATYTPEFGNNPQATATPLLATNVPPTDIPAQPTEIPDSSQPSENTGGNANGWTPVNVGVGVCVDWIVYHSNRTQNVNLFRLGELPNGAQGNENLSRGTGDEVYDTAPSLSPDKRWIAFASNRDGNTEIFISSVYQEEIIQLTFSDNAQNFNPVWSPDGRYLLFESNMSADDWELYAFDLTRGTYQRLTVTPGRDVNGSWSPDSSRILFQSNREGVWRIYEMDFATLDTQQITSGSEPMYSHDGTQIAFLTEDESTGERALALMNADGSNITRISEPATHVGAHTWSPDNRLIAYQSDVTGRSQIYVYEPESATTRQVTDSETIPAYAPTWKCDSSEAVIFTSDVQTNSDLYSARTYPLDAAAISVADEALNLTNTEFEDGYPQGLVAQNDALGREVNNVSLPETEMVEDE